MTTPSPSPPLYSIRIDSAHDLGLYWSNPTHPYVEIWHHTKLLATSNKAAHDNSAQTSYTWPISDQSTTIEVSE